MSQVKRTGVVLAAVASLFTSPTRSQDADTTLDEVIVTAQRRAENQQEVPIAITSITPAALAQQPSINTEDLAHYVPGLLTGKATFGSQTYIRGVGQSSGVPGVESPVAMYLDGIYLGAPALAVFDLNNVAQIDVLKGPQGTLFGRNATGGLIQIRTREPGSNPGASAQVGYGNYDSFTTRLYGDTELTPTLATNLALVGKVRNNGYVLDRATGDRLYDEQSWALQNKWSWSVNNNVDVSLNLVHGDYRHLAGAIVGAFPGYLANDGQTFYEGFDIVRNRGGDTNETQSTLGSLKVQVERDWGRFTSQSSATSFRGDVDFNVSAHPGHPNPNDIAAQRFALDSTIIEWSQELQWQSRESGDLRWIAGLFYLKDRTRLNSDVRLDSALASSVRTTLDTSSWSAFAQATNNLSPHTRLTAGLRYTRDTRRLDGTTETGATPASTLPPESTWPKLTWRLALDHALGETITAYASYNRGFRSGSYTNTAVNVPPAQPETVDSYELGLKSELSERRLRLNGALFYYHYDNIQLRTRSGNAIVFYNAANSHASGLDLDFDALLTAGLTLSGGLELLNARYDQFPNGARYEPSPLSALPPGCAGTPSARNGGSITLTCDLSGNRMVKSPTVTGNLRLAYTQTTRWGNLDVSLQESYSGHYFFEPDNRLRQDAFHWVNAAVSWAPGARWTLQLWGTNLGGAEVYENAVSSPGFGFGPGQPRMYGVTLAVNW